MMGRITRALRENWYMALLFVILLAAAALLYAFPKAKEVEASRPRMLNTLDPITASKTVVQPQAPRASEQESAQNTIVGLQEQFDDEPKSPNAPALLNAMANLNRQKLLNYQEAARLYELLLIDYAEWEGAAKVYPQLATCYDRMGDQTGARSVYRRMMEKFTPDTQEYLYAKAQLGL